jgi:hypothetical protein
LDLLTTIGMYELAPLEAPTVSARGSAQFELTATAYDHFSSVA